MTAELTPSDQVYRLAVDYSAPNSYLVGIYSGAAGMYRVHIPQGEALVRFAIDAPVTITIHYEGCYGKPGSTSDSIVAEHSLAPGDVMTGTLSTIIQREQIHGNPRRTSDHAAYSAEIRAMGKDVHFDFDVSLSSLGASVSCPDRAGKK